jgi:hypothetical protein
MFRAMTDSSEKSLQALDDSIEISLQALKDSLDETNEIILRLEGRHSLRGVVDFEEISESSYGKLEHSGCCYHRGQSDIPASVSIEQQ